MKQVNFEHRCMLKYIDALLETTGSMRAKDLQAPFNVCKNTTLRIVKLYIEACPGNVRLIKDGVYSKTTIFKPKFLAGQNPTAFFEELESLQQPFSFSKADQAPEWCYASC